MKLKNVKSNDVLATFGFDHDEDADQFERLLGKAHIEIPLADKLDPMIGVTWYQSSDWCEVRLRVSE